MARNYYYFALLILIWMQKSVDAINFKDIHDINSIKKFIQGISDKTPAEYYFGKVLSDSEKSKKIIDDLVGLLRNLNDLTDRNYSASRELSLRFKTFQDNSLKKNLTVFNIMDPLNAFDNIASKINSYADILIKLQNNFGYDLSEYCSEISKIRQSIAQEKEGSIIIEYNRAKDLRGVFFSNGRVSTGPDDYISCGKRVLLGKLFNDFYRHMVTSYLKEYVIRYYLDIINAQCLDQNYSSVNIDEVIFISKLQNAISSMKAKGTTANDYLWRCDPPNYDNSNGTLYYEMTHMMQTVIVKEEDLDIHHSCSHNCDTRYIENSMNHTECDGYYHCHYIDSSYEICEPPASDHSPRRYQWFKDGHGNVYGDNSTKCKTPVKKVSSTLWVSKLRSCDYCLCTCIKKKPSREDDVLFVSFREQVTDIEKNMVIVGVRFVKKNNMIHVQIKEAELKPNGLTGKSRWKELEDFSYNKSTESFYVRHSNGSQILLKEDIHYGRPTWMYLDDLIAPAGFAITGITLWDLKHSPSEKNCFDATRFRIRVTALDFFEGRLIKNQTQWFPETCHDSQYFDPIEYQLDLPIKSPQNVIDEKRGNILSFQYSSVTKDAGQSMVPFFDGQDVEGDPEFPLGGVGVVHRSRKGYGGFLAFRIYMPIFGHNFKDELFE